MVPHRAADRLLLPYSYADASCLLQCEKARIGSCIRAQYTVENQTVAHSLRRLCLRLKAAAGRLMVLAVKCRGQRDMQMIQEEKYSDKISRNIK